MSPHTGTRVAACLLFAALAAAALSGPWPAAAWADPPQRVGALYRYWSADGTSDLRDYLAYWSHPWLHVQLEYWDYVAPDSRDHFRPEVGVHLRDRRRSVYTVQWRHELDRERYTLGTDQVVGDHWVARAEASPIVWKDSTQVVVSAGADYYWGSYNFASATVIRDPRGDDLWVVPVRVRLANEADDWVQVTIAPAANRTLGWAADVKFKGVRIGFERNSRYDFTDVDNRIVTVGYEYSLPKPE
jgi:hypothetical protein